MAFTGRCTITPQTGQVPSSQTNYAVLVSVTHASLKSVANGGQCRTDGNDIRAFSNFALTSALSFYRTFYDPAAGTVRMFIKIPTLAALSPYYLGFGDNALSTDASDGPNTFSNAYSGVWPFEDGTTLNLKDITDEEFNVTNPNGATAGTAILGAGAVLDGTNDYFDVPNHINVGTSLTLTSMIKASTLSQIKVIWAKRSAMTGEGAGTANIFLLYTTAAGKLLFNVNTSGIDPNNFNNANLTGATTLSVDTVYVIHAVYNTSTGAKMYINGTQDANTAGWTGSQNGASQAVHFGDDGDSTRFFQGTFRNFQYSGTARSADWCMTDANAWLAPSTFATYVFDTPTGARSQVFIFG